MKDMTNYKDKDHFFEFGPFEFQILDNTRLIESRRRLKKLIKENYRLTAKDWNDYAVKNTLCNECYIRSFYSPKLRNFEQLKKEICLEYYFYKKSKKIFNLINKFKKIRKTNKSNKEKSNDRLL